VTQEDHEEESELASALGWGGFASLVNLVGMVAFGKVVGLVLGPIGEGYAAQLVAHSRLFASPLSVVGGPALVSNLAPALASGDQERASTTLQTATTLAAVMTPILVLLGTVVWSWNNENPALASTVLVAMALMAAAADITHNVPKQTLVASGSLNAVGRTIAGVAVAGATAGCVLVGAFGLWGYFVTPLVTASVATIAYVRTIRVVTPSLRFYPLKVDRGIAGDMVRVSMAQFSQLAAESLGMTLVYQTIRSEAPMSGDLLAGYFAAAWALGRTNISVVMQGVGLFIYPRYAAASSNQAVLHEIRRGCNMLQGMALGLFIAAAAVREPLIMIVKSAEYLPAATLFGFMLVVDLSRLMNILHGSALLYRKHNAAYAFMALSTWTIFVTAAFVLVPRFGLTGIAGAYALSFGTNIVLTSILMTRLIGRPNLAYLPRLLLSVGVLSVVIYTTTSTSWWISACWTVVGLGTASVSPLGKLLLGKVRQKLLRS